MRLLINICAHDGIVSHYNGVGSMTIRYINVFDKICNDLNIDYKINLFTPEYDKISFGYDDYIFNKHNNMKNVTIYQISNGSNKTVNFGTVKNWKLLCENTAKVINDMDFSSYDKVLTICNDTPFCCLINKLKCLDKHIKVLILHSSIKIHKVDSAIKDSEKNYNERLEWEMDGINYINNEKNSYVGSICKFFEDHLVNEYGLNRDSIIPLYNGELLYENKIFKYDNNLKQIIDELNNYDTIMISYGRAEEYKKLDTCFKLGKVLNIPSIVVAQLYFKGQPIEEYYKRSAEENDGILYIDPPFGLPSYILNNFKGKIICLIPSEEEIMGLIVNEVRRLYKDNILIVANDKGGLKEQITSGYDGVLVDLNNLKESALEITKFLDLKKMKKMALNSRKTLEKNYDFYKNAVQFINKIMEV